jgi:CheY-like chemotaxis protein
MLWQGRPWARLPAALGRALQRLAGSIAGKRQEAMHEAEKTESRPPDADIDGLEATLCPQAVPNGPLRVLVVEDDKVNQLVVIGMLRQMAHRTDCVADGVEALEALNRQRYDVVLMDVRMPNMDGIEATRRIRRLGDPAAQTPIIALTANATTEERLRCAEVGMNDFISKPFRRAELETALEKWRPPSTSDGPGGDRRSSGHLAVPQ